MEGRSCTSVVKYEDPIRIHANTLSGNERLIGCQPYGRAIECQKDQVIEDGKKILSLTDDRLGVKKIER